MAKKRTKKDKVTARHQFTISWQPSTKNEHPQPTVKRQNKSDKMLASTKQDKPKYTDYLAKDEDVVKIKKDIIKSFMLVSLILGIELMLYFAWGA